MSKAIRVAGWMFVAACVAFWLAVLVFFSAFSGAP